MLLVQQPNHRFFFNHKDPGRRHGGCGCHAKRLSGQAPLAEEVARSEHGDHGLFPALGDDRELDGAGMDVHDVRTWFPLRENDRRRSIVHDLALRSGGIEEPLWIERSRVRLRLLHEGSADHHGTSLCNRGHPIVGEGNIVARCSS